MYCSGFARKTKQIGYTFIYYKELAQGVMEVKKSQGLQPASWRLRRANNVILFQVWRPEK